MIGHFSTSKAPGAQIRNAVIVANGTLPRFDVWRMYAQRADFLLAADGGANSLAGLGITPDAVLGDFDSVSPDLSGDIVRVPAPDQNATDLDKAVAHALSLGAKHIALVGVTGDRLDHTFGSLGILVKYARSVDICLVDDIGVAYPVSHELIVDDALGRTVSLMPMGFVGRVRTTGLKWPLLDEDMDVGVRDGTSNLAVLNTVTVTVGSGVLVAYVHHRR